MVKLFERVTGGYCIKVAFQEHDKDNRYFVVPEIPQKETVTATCGYNGRTCVSWKYQCKMYGSIDKKNASTIVIEYISSLHIIDKTLQISSNDGNAIRNKSFVAENKMEFLLKYYLPHTGYPDLWIFKPPFHHETWNRSIIGMKVQLSFLLSTMKSYVPHSTKVLFMAVARECFEKRPIYLTKRYQAMWNSTKNKRIDQMNLLYYDLIHQMLNDSERWNTFLDASKITCPLVCKWHQDGAHMVDGWYSLMSEYILSTLCHS